MLSRKDAISNTIILDFYDGETQELPGKAAGKVWP